MRPTRYMHTGLFAFEKQPAAGEPAEGEVTLEIPQDDEGLAGLEDDQLDEDTEGTLAWNLRAAVDAMDDVQDPETLEKLSQLVDGIKRIRGEKDRRDEVRKSAQEKAAALRAEVNGPEPDPEGEGDGTGEGDADEAPEAKTVDAPKAEAPKAEPAAESLAAASPPNVVLKQPVRLNVPLSEIRKRAPQPDVQPRLSITAAADGR